MVGPSPKKKHFDAGAGGACSTKNWKTGGGGGESLNAHQLSRRAYRMVWEKKLWWEEMLEKIAVLQGPAQGNGESFWVWTDPATCVAT